jgi:hypothetical protein
MDHGRRAADGEGVVAVDEIADYLGERLRPLGRDRVAS